MGLEDGGIKGIEVGRGRGLGGIKVAGREEVLEEGFSGGSYCVETDTLDGEENWGIFAAIELYLEMKVGFKSEYFLLASKYEMPSLTLIFCISNSFL